MSARLVVLRCLLVGALSAGGALGLAAPAAASGTASPGGRLTARAAAGASVALTGTQLYWARRIIAVVKVQPGLAGEDQRKRAADVALMTALTESALHMYANRNNPASLRLPHERVGSDHGSVGLFQQQVGGAVNSTANWGSTAQCMSVAHSTRSFLDKLTGFDWTSYSNWAAAQKVQGSFDPTGGNYRRNEPLAIAVRKSLWALTPTTASERAERPARQPVRHRRAHHAVETYRVRRGDNLTHIAARHPHHRITVTSLAALNHVHNPNLIYVGQVLTIG